MQAAMRNQIITHLCSITDYKGTKTSFIERVEEQIGNCIDDDAGPTFTNYYLRKNSQLILTQEYKGKYVPGIILDATHRIVRTPALVVDALLGQGEALDCYNQKLQDAATVQADLENDKLEQAIAIINGITDPEKKALLYKKVFTDCCDVPQSGCGCKDDDGRE